MQYNTKRTRLKMPEYGRNIQQMVDFVLTIEDPVKRQKNAQSIIELMGILNPHLKNVEDFKHKLWDHLYIISDFEIDVDSPYPVPTREEIFRKPDPLPYPKNNIQFRHLGKNICKVMDKALETTDEEKRAGFSQAIAYCMKLAYSNWHNEPVHEDMIKEELYEISEGALSYDGMSGKVRFGKHNNNNQVAHHNNNNRRNNNQNNRNLQGKNNNNNNNNNQQQRNNNNRNNNANSGNNNNNRTNTGGQNAHFKKNNNNRKFTNNNK